MSEALRHESANDAVEVITYYLLVGSEQARPYSVEPREQALLDTSSIMNGWKSVDRESRLRQGLTHRLEYLHRFP